jgi:hypothetical protein
MYAVDDSPRTTDEPRWSVYEARQRDGFGYEKVRYGIREEYADGATRFTHNETFETREEAEILAARFHLNSRKGKTYDNVMKTWT